MTLNFEKNKISEINKIFGEFGLYTFDLDGDNLVFQAYHASGPDEDKEIYITFNNVEVFHLPLGLQHYAYKGHAINRIWLALDSQKREVMSPEMFKNVGFDDDGFCYRFSMGDIETLYYIYAESVEYKVVQ